VSEHRHALAQFVKEHGFTKGAELGIDKGILYELLLETNPDLHLLGVDVCPIPHRREKCEAIAAKFAPRATLYIGTTHDAADTVEDWSLDFVFIDADHSEKAVLDDIARWQSKVRPGGWLGGHDYHRTKFPGVVAAVNKTFTKRGVFHLPGTIWGLWR
jgi:predicted O-methyltransferase YrrM